MTEKNVESVKSCVIIGSVPDRQAKPMSPLSVADDAPLNTDSAPPVAETREIGAAVLADLVHRLRQPLSTIETCAFYLGLVLPEQDEKCREQIERIQQQIAEAGRILMEAAGHAHAARAESRSLTNAESAVVT